MQATTVVSMLLPTRSADLPSRTLIPAMSVFFALYFLTGLLGVLVYTQFGSSPQVLWPPAGIALAAVLLYGYGMWPAIALGSLMLSLVGALPLPIALGVAIANTLQPLAGAYLLELLEFDSRLAHVRDTVAIIAIAALAAAIAPAINLTALALAGAVPLSSAGVFFGSWWLGEMLSMVVLTPFIVRWSRPAFPRTSVQIAEAVTATALLVIVCFLLFWTTYSQYSGIPLAYLILAPLIWIGLRLGPRIMTLALFLASVIAVSGVVLYGSAGIATADHLLQTQLFLTILSAILLIFVSSEEERKESAKTLRGYVEKLEKALQQIQSEDRTKNEFIAVLAHELRNPLAAIRTSVEVINMELGNDERILPLITAIESRVRTTVRLLDDLLDISRISQKKLELRMETADAGEVVGRAVQSVQAALQSRGHTLRIDAPEPVYVSADPMRLEQIFVNLLTNAIKYTSTGGLIEVLCRREKDEAVVQIRDNGIGIAPEMRERIFEPFVQVGHSKYNDSGVGIGLSLTRQLVRMHNGTIGASSEGLGKGSTFTVRLPALKLEPQPVAVPERADEQPAETAAGNKGIRILVVDDNQLAAEGLCKLLSLRGYTTEPAYTGERALARAPTWKPDVIILDIGLPGMNGYQVARTLRNEQEYRGVIVALTGYGQDKDREKAAESGFDRHLVKPVGLVEVETVLQEVLN
jgi:signal transduction histidine kinase